MQLWRPPLQPGEWRTLGLFVADDRDQLEAVLASMPLRVWRTDDVLSLGQHPNDPGPVSRSEGGPEFLTVFTIAIPPDAPRGEVDDTLAREAQAARALAEDGHLVRLWKLPPGSDKPSAIGLWRAASAADLQAIIEALPLPGWMSVETTPLAPHPNDPVAVAAAAVAN